MSTPSQPTAVDYTSRDFAGLRQSMLAYAQKVAPEWSGARTGDPNDLGVSILEVFAYEGDILSYYGDRIANESFLTTATQRGSVLAHAALLDYTPRSGSAATVPLTFSVISTVPVVIPAGFEVRTAADGINSPIVFETDRDLYIPGSGTPVTLTVPATEGLVVSDEVVATSCGDTDESYLLAETPVVTSSLVVRVVEDPAGVGRVWFVVNNLLDAGPNDLAYAVSLDENQALTVLFGDGVNGRVPPRGSVVHASYRVGGGADGNVLAGSVTDIVDPTDLVFLPPIDPATGLPDKTKPPVVPTQPVALAVTNQAAAAGGSDIEGLDSIRQNAPRALRAQDRAITLSDFEALALSVPSVQIAKAKAVSSVYTNVTLYVAPPGGSQPDQATLNAVVAFLAPRKLVNVTVVAANPQYVNVNVSLQIGVDNRYSQQSVRQAVNNALQQLLAFENVSFGGRISLSDVYNAASGVPGVVSIIVSRLARDQGIGATDIVLHDNELPTTGSFSLLATGGVVNSTGLAGDVIGTGTATAPVASGAPTIGLLRCDPNSTHVELSWQAGASTTFWNVIVSYRDTTGAEVQRTVAGPFNAARAVLDLPLIGAGRAATVVFSTNAYNGAVGPVASPTSTSNYLCEGAPNTAGGGPVVPGATRRAAPQDVTWQPITMGATDGPSDRATLAYGVVQWSTPPNAPQVQWVFHFQFLHSDNTVEAAGQSTGPQYVGTTSRNFNTAGVPTLATKAQFWLQVLEDDGVTLGAISNIATVFLP